MYMVDYFDELEYEGFYDRFPYLAVHLSNEENSDIITVKEIIQLSKKLIRRIDEMDGWMEYHKDWTMDINNLIYNKTDKKEILKIVKDYIKNY